MLEAMAHGRPVVASGVGGVDSVIEDGVTGLIVPPANGAALAEQVCGLLADPDAARRIGEAGRSRGGRAVRRRPHGRGDRGPLP